MDILATIIFVTLYLLVFTTSAYNVRQSHKATKNRKQNIALEKLLNDIYTDSNGES